MSTLIVGICAALSIVLVHRDFAEIHQSLIDRAWTIEQFLARESELSMLAGNVAGLRQLALVARGQREVAYCSFFDASGTKLVGLGTSGSAPPDPPAHLDAPVGPIPVTGDVWEFRAPIFTTETQPRREELEFFDQGDPAVDAPTERKKWLGTVVLGIALESLQEHRRAAFATAASFAVLVTLLAVVAAVFLTRAFTRPLHALACAADAIAQGDLSATVRVESDDEVATVAKSFNAMIGSLAQSRAAVEARTKRLEVLNRKLEEADQLKSEFLAQVSHELRTPLNVIIGYTEMMEDGAAGEITDQQHAMLSAIGRYSRLQLDLVTDVLDLSRLTSGRMSFRIERFTLALLLAEIHELHDTARVNPQLTLTLDVAADIPELETDRVKVQEIVRNLVGNAVKFTEQGTVTIVAHASPASGHVVIEVRDTGPGIPEEEIATIFDEFRQLSYGMTRAAHGVGLGLSIARRLTEALGGTIAVSSRLGEGSTFRVELPSRFPAIERQTAA
jgi:signal transduction histidine kinase